MSEQIQSYDQHDSIDLLDDDAASLTPEASSPEAAPVNQARPEIITIDKQRFTVENYGGTKKGLIVKDENGGTIVKSGDKVWIERSSGAIQEAELSGYPAGSTRKDFVRVFFNDPKNDNQESYRDYPIDQLLEIHIKERNKRFAEELEKKHTGSAHAHGSVEDENASPASEEDNQEFTQHSVFTGEPFDLKKQLEYSPNLVTNYDQAEAEARRSNRKRTKAARVGKKALKAQTSYSKHSEGIMSKTLLPVDAARRELHLKRAERAKRKANEKERKAATQHKKLREARNILKNYGGEAPATEMGPTAQYEYEQRKQYLGSQIEGSSDRYYDRVEKANAAIREQASKYAKRRDFLSQFYNEWRALRAAERAKKQLAQARRAHARYQRINI